MLLIQGGKCKYNPSEATLEINRFLSKRSQAEIEFSEPLKSKTSIKLPLDIIFIDMLDQKEYSCNEMKCSVSSITEKGFILQFDSSVSIVKGELYIKPSRTLSIRFDSGAVLTKYPIRVPDISFIAQSTSTKTVTGTVETLNKLRTPISMVISFVAPAAASFLDTLMNILFLLKLIEGPSISYPDNILSANIELSMIPFDVGNPLNDWVENDAAECTPSEQFTKHEIACNLITNEGSQLIQVFGMLLFTIIITYLSNQLLRYFIRKLLRQMLSDKEINDIEQKPEQISNHLLSNYNDSLDLELKVEKLLNSKDLDIELYAKKSRAVRASKKIGTVLGMQFFIAKLDGNMIEMMTMSLLAIRHTSMTASGCISTLMAIAILVYYTVVAVLAFRSTLWIWHEIEMVRIEKKGLVLKGTISDHVDIKKLPHRSMGYIFEEMNVPNKYWKLLLPVVTYTMSVCICAVVTFLIGSPWQQISVSGLIILGMLGFEIVARVRESRSEQFVNILMYTFTFIYLVLKCITTSTSLAEKTRQYNLGYTMMIVLICLIVVGLVMAVTSVGLMAYRMIRAMLAKYRAYRDMKKAVLQKADGKAEDSRVEMMPDRSGNLEQVGKRSPTSKRFRKYDSRPAIDNSNKPTGNSNISPAEIPHSIPLKKANRVGPRKLPTSKVPEYEVEQKPTFNSDKMKSKKDSVKQSLEVFSKKVRANSRTKKIQDNNITSKQVDSKELVNKDENLASKIKNPKKISSRQKKYVPPMPSLDINQNVVKQPRSSSNQNIQARYDI